MPFQALQPLIPLLKRLRQSEHPLRNHLQVLVRVTALNYEVFNYFAGYYLAPLQLFTNLERNIHGAYGLHRRPSLRQPLVMRHHLGEVHAHLLDHEVLDVVLWFVVLFTWSTDSLL